MLTLVPPLLVTCVLSTPPATRSSMVMRPLVTVKVQVNGAAPASTSPTMMPVMATPVSSAVVGGPGRMSEGASLIGFTVIVTVASVTIEPPAPLFSRSSALTVSATVPLKLVVGRKRTPEESPRVAFRLASGAVRVTERVLLLAIWVSLTPPVTLSAIVSIPVLCGTLSVRRMAAAPASTSVTESPVSATVPSSSTLGELAALITGASLTALMVTGMTRVSVPMPPLPLLPRSLAVTVSITVPFWSAPPSRVRPPAAARVVFRAASGAVMATSAVPFLAT